MMASFATATVQVKQLPPISAPSSCSNNLWKAISLGPTRTSFVLPAVEGRSKVGRVFAVGSNVVSLSNQSFWEDPDDGSGSEYDDDDDDDEEEEDEEVEENNLDFESDWEEEEEEEERVASATASSSVDRPSKTTINNYEEDLLNEVEQLLEPEERAILQRNAAPHLGKISTAKWNTLCSLALAGQIHYMDMLLGNRFHSDLVDKDSRLLFVQYKGGYH